MAEKFEIRPATESDAKNIFDLSNDPVVRANSIHREKIEWESHLKWYANMLKNPDCAYFVGEFDGAFCGQVRFNRDGGAWIASISVAAPFRGKHIGAKMLSAAISRIAGRRITALIKSQNTASIKMFSSCGFQPNGEKAEGGETYNILEYGE